MSAGLCVRGLSKHFTAHLRGARRTTVLADVDLDVAAGSFTAVTGPSGSGKSSLLRCVYRSYRPDGGSIVVEAEGGNIDLATADARAVLETRRSTIGLATQFLQVIPRVSALDLVAAAGADRTIAADYLARLGLDADRADDPPATFSGGERQMVGLAMALARPRPLLLLDEPTASLDPVRRALALAAIGLHKRSGGTVLAVFHEVPDVPGLVDEVVALRDGRL